jgi:hypothetical protein
MTSFSQKIATNIKNRTFKKGLKNLFWSIYRKIKFSNFHYFLNKNRLLTKKYEKKFKAIDNNQVDFSNYYLDKRMKLSPASIIYSFGILNDVGFELEVSNKIGCVVNMFDPTPLTIEFIKDNYASYDKFKYKPIGLWKEDKVLSFYTAKEGGSASAVLDIAGNNRFDASCYTLGSIMKQLGHSGKTIDVLKMDIEGAALPAMMQFFEEGIFPLQVIAEFERPKKNVVDFFAELDKLNAIATANGYEIYLISRPKEKYYAVELLYVKIKN